MCGRKYCPMHNFREIDWEALGEAARAGSR